jgi:hypothetical protein
LAALDAQSPLRLDSPSPFCSKLQWRRTRHRRPSPILGARLLPASALVALHLALDRSCDVGHASQLHLHRIHLPRHWKQNDRIRASQLVPQGPLAEVAYARDDRGFLPFFVVSPTFPHPTYLLRPRRYPGFITSSPKRTPHAPQQYAPTAVPLDRVFVSHPSSAPRWRCKFDIIAQPRNAPLSQKFHFRGVCTYLESLVTNLDAVAVYELVFNLFYQPRYTVLHVSAFLRRTKRFGFDGIRINFWPEGLVITATPAISPSPKDVLRFSILCDRLDFQVASAAQICRALGPNFGNMEDLFVKYSQDQLPTQWHNEVDPTLWRELLSQFRGMKTLWISSALVSELTNAMGYDTLQFFEDLPILAWVVVEIHGDDPSTTAARSLSELLARVRSLGGPVVDVYRLFSDKWKMGRLPKAVGVPGD